MLNRLNLAPRKRGQLAAEGGFTLTELLVVAGVLAIVAIAIMTFILVSARTFGSQEDRVTRTDDARNALLRISSELRDAGTVTITGGVVTAQVRQADGSVTPTSYSCTTGGGGLSSCSATTAAGSTLLVENVVNSDVFAAIAGSDSGASSLGGGIQIRMALDLEESSNPIVLTTAVKPRNCAAFGTGVVNPPC